MSTTESFTERDRIEAELAYATRACNWNPTPECIGAIVTWHLHAVALARAEAWVPGMAEGDDPVIETALNRFHHHQFGRIIQRLRDDNTRLKLKLTAVCRCLEFYCSGSPDVGIRAAGALRALHWGPPADDKPELHAGPPMIPTDDVALAGA